MGDAGGPGNRMERWIGRLAAHVSWLVPVVLGTLIGGGALVGDRALIDASRRHVVAVVDEAALAAAADPVSGERIAAEALLVAGLDDRSRVDYARGRLDAAGFVPLEGVGTAVRLRVTTYLPAPWRRLVGLAEPVFEAEAIAILSGAAILEIGPPATAPGPIGRVLLSAFAGFDLPADAAAWLALERTPVPLDRLFAAIRGGEEIGDAADGARAPLPMRLAVEALAIAAQPDDAEARSVLATLSAAAALSAATLDLDRQIRLADEAAPPVLSAATVLLAFARAAAGEEPRNLRLIAPSDGIIALDGVLTLSGAGGRVLAVKEGDEVATPSLLLSLVATVPANDLPGALNARVPLRLRVDPAQVRLDEVGCSGTGGADLSARPAPAAIAFSDPAGEPSLLVEAPTLAAWVDGGAVLEGGQPVALAFSADDLAEGRLESARTTLPFPVLVGRLFAAPVVTVRVDGDRITPAAARDEAVRLVRDTTPYLGAALADILGALGLSPGDAAVRVHALQCADATLVGGAS